MERILHTLKDYIALLEQDNLLAAPLPELDLNAIVHLVSYDSRDVVPGTLFICKGAHFKPEFLASAKEKGAMAYISLTPTPRWICPAFWSMICAAPSHPWPISSTATPPPT